MNNRPVIESYEDLEVYQLAMKLAVEIDAMTKDLPKHEFWEEGQQIRKSSKGIPAHIAEGFGRRDDPAEYRRFAIYALSSCDETHVHLGLLYKCGSIDKSTYDYFKSQYTVLGKKMNNWLKSIDKRVQSAKR
jgi:four helix bundle protein